MVFRNIPPFALFLFALSCSLACVIVFLRAVQDTTWYCFLDKGRSREMREIIPTHDGLRMYDRLFVAFSVFHLSFLLLLPFGYHLSERASDWHFLFFQLVFLISAAQLCFQPILLSRNALFRFCLRFSIGLIPPFVLFPPFSLAGYR
jgi:hypothetical protein